MAPIWGILNNHVLFIILLGWFVSCTIFCIRNINSLLCATVVEYYSRYICRYQRTVYIYTIFISCVECCLFTRPIHCFY